MTMDELGSPLQHSDMVTHVTVTEEHAGAKDDTAIQLGERKLVDDSIVIQPKAMPTLFGDIPERNVTFCIDTSGSMYNCLDAVKEHLTEFLISRANENRFTMFNVIEFNTDVTQWADKMVNCSPQTVTVASKWIRTMEAKTGTNTRDALVAALQDDSCEAVCLVTDGYPDQHPSEIIDVVSSVAQNRPIHCFYIHDGTAQVAATDFLKQLAMTTFGSFHVITVAQHGAIERVTPVYRAHIGPNHVVRSTDQNVFIPDMKECSVTTTLDAPIEHKVFLDRQPIDVAMEYHSPAGGYVENRYPYFYYYVHPALGWSRFRPAKSWMKTADSIMEAASQLPFSAPGPGALLIGNKVLARRIEDGFYYLGTVRSQIFEDKFLIEFGPCKHGKYTDLSYQETNLFDIVSHTDALRHSIMIGDRVLATFQPEGEKYSPGVVIEGQEKRDATGGGDDSVITVSFYDGKTADVPGRTAVWIPVGLYERIAFEMTLPTRVRQDLTNQAVYPTKSLPGYPTNSIKASPKEYDFFEPVTIQRSLGRYDRGMYQSKANYFVPVYSKSEGPLESSSYFLRSNDMNRIIPGTELTTSALNEKVMQQIMEHKGESSESRRLLEKRELMDENNLMAKKLEKSVSFQDVDSGRGTSLELESPTRECISDYSDYDLTDEECWAESGRKSVAVGTDKSLLQRRKVKRKQTTRPPWKYWKNETTPELLESNHYGPYRYGPFEDNSAPPPLESRLFLRNQSGIEWVTAMSRYVDNEARYKSGQIGVRDCMYIPRPPEEKADVEKQGANVDISITLAGQQPSAEKSAATARRDFRRQKMVERRITEAESRENTFLAKSAMENQRRELVKSRIENEQTQRLQEHDTMHAQRDAKRAVSEQVRTRLMNSQKEEVARDQGYAEARQANIQRRLEQENLRNCQRAEQAAERRAQRELEIQTRRQQQVQKEMQAMTMDEAKEQLRRNAKINRIEHFRQLEEQGQRYRNQKYEIHDRQHAMERSQVFP